jgi:hypothetical protein
MNKIAGNERIKSQETKEIAKKERNFKEWKDKNRMKWTKSQGTNDIKKINEIAKNERNCQKQMKSLKMNETARNERNRKERMKSQGTNEITKMQKSQKMKEKKPQKGFQIWSCIVSG